MSGPNIVLRECDPAWPGLFEGWRGRVLDALGGLAGTVEHPGSTAVPGLVAKPVVDIDAVVPSAEDVSLAVEPPADAPWHHLYVSTAGGEELRRHLAFRDYLRRHPEEASAYAALERGSARRFGGDRRACADSKGEFVERSLSRAIGAR